MNSSSGSLEAVVEQLTNFRSEVRAFALTCQDDTNIRTSKKPGLYPERISLLKACDSLRNDLAPLGILIKVHRVGSHHTNFKLVFLYFKHKVATCMSVTVCRGFELKYFSCGFRIEEPPQHGQ